MGYNFQKRVCEGKIREDVTKVYSFKERKDDVDKTRVLRNVNEFPALAAVPETALSQAIPYGDLKTTLAGDEVLVNQKEEAPRMKRLPLPAPPQRLLFAMPDRYDWSGALPHLVRYTD